PHPDLPPGASAIITAVARDYAMGAPRDTLDEVLRALAKKRGRRQTEAVLAGLAEGWRSGHKVELKEETEKALVAHLPKLSASGKASLLKLMGALGSKAVQKHAVLVQKSLLATVEKDDAAENE